MMCPNREKTLLNKDELVTNNKLEKHTTKAPRGGFSITIHLFSGGNLI